MNFMINMLLNIFSVLLLSIIYIHSLNHMEKGSLQQKLYMTVVQVVALLLVVDIFSRFDGNLGTIYPIFNAVGNFLIFLLSPVLPSLWLMYAHMQVFHDEKRTKRLLVPLAAINAINAVLLVLSQFHGWFYSIDAGNVYHRGPLFLLPASITVALILIAFVMIVVNRSKVEKRYYFSLVFFAIPPSICVFLQIIIYGYSLMLNSIVLSLLIVFLNMQNNSLYTDYLTGINNRKKFETYMKDRINASTENKTFSAILIDMDDFKLINDTLGHDVGDDALETFVKLLKSCMRSNDFIARFGGDEFYMILDVTNSTDLDAAVTRLKTCIEKHNESNSKPYELKFSMGYAVYDYRSHLTMEQFQKQIDIMMYENKRVNKQINL